MNVNKIVMVASKGFIDPDPRIYREAKALVDHGFNVTVYVWDRECKRPRNELIDGIFVERIHVRSKYGSLFAFILTIPIFWLFAFLKILAQNISIVHCHDFDTVPVGILVKMLKRNVKVVYDAHEIYPEMIINKIPYILYILLRWIDKIFMRVADCVIVPSEERKKFYAHAKYVIVVPNVPKFVEIYRDRELKKRDFFIFYGGGLSEDNGILLMISAVMQLPGIKLILAGDGPLRDVIQMLCKKSDKILYLGRLPQQKVLENLAHADVTFVLYSPTNLNNIYSAPNKLFEAMMIGVPVIVNKESVHSRIVHKYKCGIAVPYGDLRALKRAILKLKNDVALREKLGENGKVAFKENFAWNLIEKKFINCYQEMLCRN
jgi:glycosyltransferase involved in cell wall biosynthesis